MNLLNLPKIYLEYNKTYNKTKNYADKTTNTNDLNVFLLVFCPIFLICFFCWCCWCCRKKNNISPNISSKSSFSNTNIYPQYDSPPIIDQINETNLRQTEMTVKYNRIRTESN